MREPELENLLLSRGISLPSEFVKADDATSEVSNAEESAPQPVQSMTSLRNVKKKANAMRKRSRRLGYVPILTRFSKNQWEANSLTDINLQTAA